MKQDIFRHDSVIVYLTVNTASEGANYSCCIRWSIFNTRMEIMEGIARAF